MEVNDLLLIAVHQKKKKKCNCNCSCESWGFLAIDLELVDGVELVTTDNMVCTDPEKSWKIYQMVAAFLTHVHRSGLYIDYHCQLQHGSTTFSSNTVKLQLIEIFGKGYW